MQYRPSPTDSNRGEGILHNLQLNPFEYMTKVARNEVSLTQTIPPEAISYHLLPEYSSQSMPYTQPVLAPEYRQLRPVYTSQPQQGDSSCELPEGENEPHSPEHSLMPQPKNDNPFDGPMLSESSGSDIAMFNEKTPDSPESWEDQSQPARNLPENASPRGEMPLKTARDSPHSHLDLQQSSAAGTKKHAPLLEPMDIEVTHEHILASPVMCDSIKADYAHSEHSHSAQDPKTSRAALIMRNEPELQRMGMEHERTASPGPTPPRVPPSLPSLSLLPFLSPPSYPHPRFY